MKGQDNLRKGYLTVGKFKHGLSILEMNLNEEDYLALLTAYEFEENGCRLVNYK